MELLITIDALRRASAAPHHGRHPLFRLCPAGPQARPAHADLGQAGRQPDHQAGADRVLTLDLHAGQIQGFFDIPTDNLFAAPRWSPTSRRTSATGNLMVVSPDVGGVVRARALAKRIDAPTSPSSTSAASAPACRGHEHHRRRVRPRCILVDDIVDSPARCATPPRR
jgi:ribose-phosphate pyrophosphokinase